MQILVHLAVISAFILAGFGSLNGSIASQASIKIKITHSHAHSHTHDHEHHHHDDLASDSSHEVHEEHHEAQTENHASSQASTSDQHSHDVLISCGHTVFIEQAVVLPIAFATTGAPHQDDILPPRNRSLSSIFRPPISA